MLNQAVDLLLPPAGLAMLALVLLLLGGRWPRRLALVSVAALVLLGTPIVARALLNSLPRVPVTDGPAPQAIVILSAEGVRVAGDPDLEPGAAHTGSVARRRGTGPPDRSAHPRFGRRRPGRADDVGRNDGDQPARRLPPAGALGREPIGRHLAECAIQRRDPQAGWHFAHLPRHPRFPYARAQ